LPIRAVLFDLWGTLIVDDADRSEERRLLRIRMACEALASLGHDYDPATVETAFRRATEEHARIHEAERDVSARARTELYLHSLDPTLPARLDADGWRMMDAAILEPALSVPPRRMPGAEEALRDVRALGLPVALVSNAGITPGFVLERILHDMRLLPLLDVRVFSDEVALAKPAPGIFHHALDAVGVTAADAAFIGDQPVLDVFGARRAGIRTLQIGDVRHPDNGLGPLGEPHARIASLDELMPALRSLDGAG
jgi:putative hydrolase of the HAD superfamily